MRSPQTMGLECASPGMAAFHSTFSAVSPFHCTAGSPVPTPEAPGPRNWGQCAWPYAPTEIRNSMTLRIRPVYVQASHPCLTNEKSRLTVHLAMSGRFGIVMRNADVPSEIETLLAEPNGRAPP